MRWYALSLTVCVACADLPQLERAVCGNAIVEEGEDCDGFPFENGAECLAPGESGACHYDCSLGRPCPPDWACDVGGVCRQPSGTFAEPVRYAVGGVDALQAGDFDGDGRADLLSRDPSDFSGRSTLRFHYFDARAVLVETRSFRKQVVAPAIGKLWSAQFDDLVFSDLRLGVLRGRADRSWVPEAFTPYVLRKGVVRLTGMREGSVDGVSPLATVGQLGEKPGVYSADTRTGEIVLRAEIVPELSSLLGEPLPVDLTEGPGSPCDELVLGFRGEKLLRVYDTCELDGASAGAAWRAAAVSSEVALVPEAELSAPPVSADLNGDGHNDLLVGAGEVVYAAYGDGRALSSATPYQPLSEATGLPFSMPLAVGELSGDSAPDFVLPSGILLSRTAVGSSRPHYEIAYRPTDGDWTSAKIVDLNGNGFLDVVAATRGRLHVDLLSGSGKPWLIESKVLSARPVTMIDTGDFDGDIVTDLVMVEQGDGAAGLDTVRIAFGVPGALPEAPQTVARARAVQQIGVYREAGTESMSVVASHPTDDARALAYLFGGNAERIPFAALELSGFSQNGRIGNVVATAVLLGRFESSEPRDALALAVNLDDKAERAWEFWLVPSMNDPLPASKRLDGALDPRLTPSDPPRERSAFAVTRQYATGVAADLGGDARDESVWVMPADQRARCGIQTMRMDGSPEAESSLRADGLVVLDVPCEAPQVAATDLDQDGHRDLIVLTGAKDAPDRKLFVLWNDGTGHFSADNLARINGDEDSPRAFAWLAPVGSTQVSLVYVTRTEVVQWRYVGARTFAARHLLNEKTPLRNATGVVAADFDGDHVQDLAVADDGDLAVLRGQVR